MTVHVRANDAYCTCGRRFYSDVEQARHEQWDNLTELQQARALAALLPSPPATTDEDAAVRVLKEVDAWTGSVESSIRALSAAYDAAASPPATDETPPLFTGPGFDALCCGVRALERHLPTCETHVTPSRAASPPATTGDAPAGDQR